MSEVLARAGEVVTCENGHPICDVAVDLVRNMPGPLAEQFTNWRDLPQQVRGMPIPMCPHCGAVFMKAGPGRVHIDGAWRPFP